MSKGDLTDRLILARGVAARSANYFGGSTTVFVDPPGAGCMPGGLCPWGLSGGGPDLVSSGPVQPCGCNWPFSSGGERPVVVFTLRAGLRYRKSAREHQADGCDHNPHRHLRMADRRKQVGPHFRSMLRCRGSSLRRDCHNLRRPILAANTFTI